MIIAERPHYVGAAQSSLRLWRRIRKCPPQLSATGNVLAHRFYEQMDFIPRPVTGMRYLQALA